MANPTNCNPCCSTATTTQIPGPAGTDATVLPPIVGSPEGVLVGTPGQTVLNSTDDSYWVKKTGTGNTGWLQLIGLWMFLFIISSALALPPILRGPFTTNTPTAQLTLATNIADGEIAKDVTHQQTNAALTTFVASPKFTGVITNISTLRTNVTYVVNGIITTNVTTYP